MNKDPEQKGCNQKHFIHNVVLVRLGTIALLQTQLLEKCPSKAQLSQARSVRTHTVTTRVPKQYNPNCTHFGSSNLNVTSTAKTSIAYHTVSKTNTFSR